MGARPAAWVSHRTPAPSRLAGILGRLGISRIVREGKSGWACSPNRTTLHKPRSAGAAERATDILESLQDGPPLRGSQRMFALRPPTVRRLAAWLLIAQQVLVSSGMPLPCPAAAAGAHQRYPCEDCGCACLNAEQCWARCCCFTHQQKIAWAREHGVAVPAYVAAAAKQEPSADDKRECTRCAGRVGPPADASSATPCARDHQRQSNREKKARRERGVCWLDVARCHGVASHAELAGASWPGDPPSPLRLALPLLGRIAWQPFLESPFTPPSPPTPPPRIA